MKAHIRPSRPCVLAYGMEDTFALSAICQKEGFDLVLASVRDLRTPLGKLCNLPGSYQKGPEARRTDFLPALFFSGFGEEQLDKMLADLKANSIAVPLKAVLTASNRIWPLAEVLEELEEEHAAFQKGENA